MRNFNMEHSLSTFTAEAKTNQDIQRQQLASNFQIQPQPNVPLLYKLIEKARAKK